jgi:peptide/nickel transport system substrate-binding protein
MANRPTVHTPTRRKALRDMAALGGLAAAGGLAGSVVHSTPAAAAPNDQLVVAVAATPVSLDPEFGASLESWELPVFIYEYLVSYRFEKGADGVGLPQFDGPLEPRLAEKYEVSADGKKITFYLRKGVKSEHGNEFTAEDVKWSWSRAFALNTAGTWMMKSSSVPNADAIRVVSPNVLEVDLSGPNALLVTEQATPLNNPVIYDSTEAKKHASAADPWAKEWLGKNSSTFGPYRVTKFTPGQQVVFEVNPNYYREKPKIRQVIWREVPSSATRLQLLIAGSAHIVKELDSRERQQVQGKPGVQVISIKGNEGIIFGLNNKVKPLDNVKVRQAIAYAAPIDAIIQTVYLKQPNVRLLKGYTPETYPAAIDYWPYYATDLEKAKALLKEAGQGPFSFKLSQNASRPEHEQVAIQIQTQLKKLDIDVQIEKLTPAKYQEQYFSRKAEAVLVQDAAWVADPAYSLGLFFGTGPTSVANWVNYESKEVDALLTETFNTADPAKRRDLGRKVHRMIVDDAPWGFYIGTGFYLTARSEVVGLNWRPNNMVNYAELSFKQ